MGECHLDHSPLRSGERKPSVRGCRRAEGRAEGTGLSPRALHKKLQRPSLGAVGLVGLTQYVLTENVPHTVLGKRLAQSCFRISAEASGGLLVWELGVEPGNLHVQPTALGGSARPASLQTPAHQCGHGSYVKQTESL